jgi:hypothetical protein
VRANGEELIERDGQVYSRNNSGKENSYAIVFAAGIGIFYGTHSRYKI